jgi:hypothetical protein
MNKLHWIFVLILVVLLFGCMSAFPLLRDAKLNKAIQPYLDKYGPYTYMEIRLTEDLDGYLGFLWLSPDGSHAIMLSQFNGEWFVQEQ